MAGSLIKIAETTVSSAVASVTLTGIDSTFDVYMIKFFNVTGSTDQEQLNIRVTKSGSADTTSNYDRAYKQFRTNSTFNNVSGTNSDHWDSGSNIGTGTSETTNGILYAFNFNNASEFSFLTIETTELNNAEIHHGSQGGLVHTVASASDGLNFFMSSGNIAQGTFSLYGLKK